MEGWWRGGGGGGGGVSFELKKIDSTKCGKEGKKIQKFEYLFR